MAEIRIVRGEQPAAAAGTARLWVDGALKVNFLGATCSAAAALGASVAKIKMP